MDMLIEMQLLPRAEEESARPDHRRQDYYCYSLVLFGCFVRCRALARQPARLLEPIVSTALRCRAKPRETPVLSSNTYLLLHSIRPSRLSSVCVSVHHHHQHLSHNLLLLAIAPSSDFPLPNIYHSSSIVLSAITSARPQSIQIRCLFDAAAHTHTHTP
jgi:hypothetical protein